MFISEFDELNLNPGEVFTGNNPFVAQGEIALLVATQQGETPISNTSFDNHVVIHYSGDTREGQFANFRNQRVFGPKIVDSQFLSMEFVVLEVDRPTDQDAALFKKLADLGVGLAGTTAGPTFAVLADLGSALLSAPNDDLQTKFRMTFDLGARPGARLPLVPGLYAIVREDDRGYPPGARQRSLRSQTQWSDLKLDPMTGELRVIRDGHETPYVENTYLIISVEAALAPETHATQTYAAFVDDLRKVQNPTTGAFLNSVTALAATYALDERKAAMTTALARLATLADQYGRTKVVATCDVSMAAEHQAAVLALREQSVALHRLILLEAGTLTDADAANDYDAAAYRDNMLTLTRFFGSLDWGSEWSPPKTAVELLSESSNPANFMAVFGDLTTFDTHVADKAATIWPQNC